MMIDFISDISIVLAAFAFGMVFVQMHSDYYKSNKNENEDK